MTETCEVSELEQIVSWRMAELLRAGCSIEEADQLAGRLDIDLHKAIDMLGNGCPAELAVRILM